MSDLITANADLRDVAESLQPVTEKPPVLITEKEVLFSTAAAAASPRMTAGLESRAARPPMDLVPPRHYPLRRESFIEAAAMAREMHRL